MAYASRMKAAGPEAQLIDGKSRGRSRKELLVIGEIPRSLQKELAARGAVLTQVATLSAGFVALSEHRFEVVLLNADTDGCGLDLVTALKEGPAEHEHTVATLYGARGGATFLRGVRPPEQATLERLRRDYAFTPFVVMPQGGSFYAVIVQPPAQTAWINLEKVPIATTVMTTQAGKVGARA